MNQVIINEAPIITLRGAQHTSTVPYDSHSIVIDDPKLIITLRLNGKMSHFQTRKPTATMEDECRENLDLVPQPRDRKISSLSNDKLSDFDNCLVSFSTQSTSSIR
jgi:hypothetical protein